MEDLEAVEVLVGSGEGWVLVFAAEVLKVQVLVDCKAEEDLVVNEDLLLGIVIWVQGLDGLMDDCHRAFFCCFDKVKINLCESSISLDSFVHCSLWKLLACLELFVPVSLVLLINAEES